MSFQLYSALPFSLREKYLTSDPPPPPRREGRIFRRIFICDCKAIDATCPRICFRTPSLIVLFHRNVHYDRKIILSSGICQFRLNMITFEKKFPKNVPLDTYNAVLTTPPKNFRLKSEKKYNLMFLFIFSQSVPLDT